MKFFIFSFVILSLGAFPIEVTSIDCPRANPLDISPTDFSQLLKQGYHTNKYITAPNFVHRISFPAKYNELPHIRYINHYPSSTPTVTIYTSVSQQSAHIYSRLYKFIIDPYKPILDIIGPFEDAVLKLEKMRNGIEWTTHEKRLLDASASPSLIIALVYYHKESEGSFCIYQSCDGKYAWVQIDHNTIMKLMNKGKDPLNELNDKINAALNNLNIDNGVIYDTTDNHMLDLFDLM